jgi:hypothetical protein
MQAVTRQTVKTILRKSEVYVHSREPGDMATSHRTLVTRSADQMATFRAMAAAAVTLVVSILIYNSVVDALPDTSGVSGAINLSEVTPTIESAFVLAPVALIVLIAAIVLRQISSL